MFEFADRHRGAYSASLHSAVCPFYCDVNGYQVGKKEIKESGGAAVKKTVDFTSYSINNFVG